VLVRTNDNLRLKFEHPPALSAGVNVFPVASTSFAGEVARTSRGAIDNGFAAAKHLGFYERIHRNDARMEPIQKLMAVPMRAGQFSFAVVEVGRRGATAAEAGPDFAPSDLGRLAEVCEAVAPTLSRLRPRIT